MVMGMRWQQMVWIAGKFYIGGTVREESPSLYPGLY
jgi:hypothetical protein